MATNSSTEADDSAKARVVVSLFFLLIISVFAIFGNILVCAAFAKNKSLRILTNYYVVSLAVSDILVGAINVPIWMYILASNLRVGEYLEEAYVIFDIMSGTASIWNMTMISLDRFAAVTQPTVYRLRLKNRKVTLSLLTFTWTFSILVASLHPLYKMFNYAVFVTTLSFLIPFVIIVGSYGYIFRVVRHRAKWTGSVLMEIKMARTLSIVIGAFIICWGPFFILNIVSYYCRGGCKYEVAVRVIKWMQYASACVNPVVYTIRNRDFRLAFHKLIFQCSKRNGKYIITPRRRGSKGLESFSMSSRLETRTRLTSYTEDPAQNCPRDQLASSLPEEPAKTNEQDVFATSHERLDEKARIIDVQ